MQATNHLTGMILQVFRDLFLSKKVTSFWKKYCLLNLHGDVCWEKFLSYFRFIRKYPSLQLKAMLVVCSCSEYCIFSAKEGLSQKNSHKNDSKLLAPPTCYQTQRNPPIHAKHLVSPVCPRCLLQSLDRNGCRDTKRLCYNVPLKHQ